MKNVKIEPKIRLLDVFSSLVGWNVLDVAQAHYHECFQIYKVYFSIIFQFFKVSKNVFFLLRFALSEVEHVVHDVTVLNFS